MFTKLYNIVYNAVTVRLPVEKVYNSYRACIRIKFAGKIYILMENFLRLEFYFYFFTYVFSGGVKLQFVRHRCHRSRRHYTNTNPSIYLYMYIIIHLHRFFS